MLRFHPSTLFRLPILAGLLFSLNLASAFAGTSYVSKIPVPAAFPLARADAAAPLYVDEADFPGVLKVAAHLQGDVEKVTGKRPVIAVTSEPVGEAIVVIGTLGRSALVDRLVEAGKLDDTAVRGKWEKFGIQSVANPFPGVAEALVIFGSDKRGTIFGIYDLATEIGVSPWYWWADVPVQESEQLYVLPGMHTRGEPKVKYRGIFINDEAPALTNWAEETFGGFNHQFYEKVYELILRNKGNYLWPAMWVPAAFYEDDPENARLADELGIVIATTHHEPMMRAHDEWARFGEGPWNYETNAERLKEFWRGGIERMGDYESVVTVGMRGDGDEAMSEDTAIGLMERIIDDQRQIIEEVTGKPASETPQVWALYKEMQDYWDKGMRVPDDVLVLLCDDNWGNVRILPKAEDRDHPGGFGMYYHFDFVGGPVSYRWLNVTQIERVWEQMRLTYEWGVEDLWLVNVGDIKPMELPISFFLDLAWDPEAIAAEDLPGYYEGWAEQQFGEAHAAEIGELLSLQTKYAARRTPEMIGPDTFSPLNYRESDRVLAEYESLISRARVLYEELPDRQKDAFYQLVLFPAEAMGNLTEMYIAAEKNRIFGEQGRASANDYAELTEALFAKDAELVRTYHEDLADGKWNHMMSQTHIGYTSWNNPIVDKMPAVSRVKVPDGAGLGYALEYGAPGINTQGGARYARSLPAFDAVNDQNYYIEVFNTGTDPVEYSMDVADNWIQVSDPSGTVEGEARALVSIDWENAPDADAVGEIRLSGAGETFEIEVPILRRDASADGFVENAGVVSIPAEAFTKAISSDEGSWSVVPNLGRRGSAVLVEPMDMAPKVPGENAPLLEYTFTLFEQGDVTIETHLSPTLNYKKESGLRFAIAIDDAEPQIVNMHEGETVPDWEYPLWWNMSVTDHVKIVRSQHSVDEPGVHTLRVWAVDPGVVFQHFVVDAGGLKPSYLGPPTSVRAGD